MSKPICLAFVLLVVLGASGCPTVDLGDVPPDPGQCRPSAAYFRDVIWPSYLAPADASTPSCVSASGCHRRDDGRSALRLDVLADGQTDLDLSDNYAVTTRFLNCGSPESSPLLSKPISGVDPHGGGDQFGPGSQAETVFLQWFQEQ